MINKIQQGNSTTFRAKFYPHPKIAQEIHPDVLKNFEQKTAKYHGFDLRQCSYSSFSAQSDAFALYKDNKYLCTLRSKFNDICGKPNQCCIKGDTVADRLVEILNNLIKRAGL